MSAVDRRRPSDYPDCMFKQQWSGTRARRRSRRGLAPFGSLAHAAPRGLRRPGGVRVGTAQRLLRLDVRRPRRRHRRGRARSARSAPAPTACCWSAATTGSIRAFANTCRHRGHELLACGATAKRRSIVCPYHSWSYRLDGALRNAPGFDDGLRPRRVRADRAAAGRLARLAVRRRQRHRRRIRRHVAGLEDVVARLPARGPGDRRPALLRAGHQLEGHRRELPGVLPLLDHPPRAVQDQPADQRGEPRLRGLVDGRLDVDDRRRRDDVAHRQERRRGDQGPVRARAAAR